MIELEAYFINHAETAYEFGLPFTVEKEICGAWNFLPEHPNIAYPRIGFYLPAGSDTRKANFSKINLVRDLSNGYCLYGDLTPGKYRIVWSVAEDSSSNEGYLAAELKVTATT